jgi:rod shape-determining protein MreD
MQILLLLIATFFVQGFVSGLLGDSIAPPDFVYIAVLLIVSRTSAFLGLPLAFVTGITQDLLSAGIPGLHAIGLLFAAYAYYRLSRLVHWGELAGQMVILVGSFLAKWLGYMVMAYWLRMSGFNPLTLWSVILPEMVLTLLLAPWLVQAYRGVFGARNE